jgi:hypothetical protein
MHAKSQLLSTTNEADGRNTSSNIPELRLKFVGKTDSRTKGCRTECCNVKINQGPRFFSPHCCLQQPQCFYNHLASLSPPHGTKSQLNLCHHITTNKCKTRNVISYCIGQDAMYSVSLISLNIYSP